MTRRPDSNRLRAAVWLLAGSLAWALAMGASAALSLLSRDWQNHDAQVFVVALFGAGAFIAYAPATIIARYLGGRRAETRFAATMVLLAGATIALTAFFFGTWYRLYYARWHEPAFSIGWTLQNIFTMVAAFYHFLVLGLRMYVPFGLAALLAFSMVQARQRR